MNKAININLDNMSNILAGNHHGHGSVAEICEGGRENERNDQMQLILIAGAKNYFA